MLNKLFKKKKYISLNQTSTANHKKKHRTMPKDIYLKCNRCSSLIYKKDVEEGMEQCPECQFLFRMNPRKRLNNVLDEDSFEELNNTISNDNPLAFEGYEDKIKKYESKTEEKSAIVTGIGHINKKTVAIGVMNPYFMMGSMGSVVGEKLTRLIEYATEQSLPLIIFTASGGARMQEGVYSLLQMAKTSAALKKHAEAKHLYISVLTDPTTGGVSASFAMLGDIIIAEPDALIGFAGPRVIKQTIKKELPEGFQKSEFLLATGFIDFICERSDLRDTLDRLLIMHGIDAND